MPLLSSGQTDNSTDPSRVWIYHERQEALLCGQHALNNLVQEPGRFHAGVLSETASALDQLERSMLTGSDLTQHMQGPSANVDESGNFSIQVLVTALQQMYPAVEIVHHEQDDLKKTNKEKKLDITDMQGFLCHKSDHWFAIRKVGGRFWDLNSTKEQPVVLGHFALATEMKTCAENGYTIFCIPSGLPFATGHEQALGATTSGEWHNMASLLNQGGNSSRGSSSVQQGSSSWTQNAGTGMRLDGKMSGPVISNLEGLTEEEQLQLALQASLEPGPTQKSHESADDDLPVPNEPVAGSPGAVSIQFRFMHTGKREVRRFLADESVGHVYAYCRQVTGKQVELRAGFPPRDLTQQLRSTIKEASLANESVQVRLR